jgi:shikimate kinase
MLHGFRAVGKSTTAKLLAEKLGWRFIEMDEQIEKLAGMPISKLTQNGANWVLMRKLENQVLRDVLKIDKAVISSGGGVTVNGIIDPVSGKTFGELNSELIHKCYDLLNFVLYVGEDILRERLVNDEMAHVETKRPVLNSQLASQINDKEISKEEIVKVIVEDAMKMYQARKPLYDKLSEYQVDTEKSTPQEVVEQIFNIMLKLK